MGPLFIFIGILALIIIFVIVKDYNEDKELSQIEEEQAKQKEKAKSTKRWDSISISNGTQECKKCSGGQLVYSHSNMSLREGTKIEYFYCLTCEIDTAIQTV